MNFYEMVDVALSIGNRMDAQWGFFISIHLALLGGVFFVDKPVSLRGKLVTMSVYVLFAVFNFRALRLQQRLLDQTYTDIVKLGNSPCCQDSALMAFYVNEVADSFATRMMTVASLLHLAAFGIFAFSVYSIRSQLDGDFK